MDNFKFLIKLAIFFLAFFSNCIAHEFNYKIKNYNISDGLSQSTVYSFHKDSLGFLWIGTQTGLNRFDGKNFKIFDKFTYKDYIVEKNYINDIQPEFVNGQEIFWLATETGLVRFNPRNFKSIIYRQEPNNKNSLLSDQVKTILVDKNGNKWIGTKKGGINLIKKNSEEILSIELPYGNIDVNKIYEDKDGNIWFLSSDGMIYFISPNKTIKKLEYKTKVKCLFDKCTFYDITYFKEEIFILAASKGIICFDKKKKEFVKKDFIKKINQYIGNSPVTSVIKRGNNLYIGTSEKGILVYSFKTMDIHHIDLRKSNSSNVVNKLYIDKENNLFAGTQSGGFNIIQIKDNLFYLLRNNLTSKIKLPSNSIFGLYEESNTLWIGTLEGLMKLDFTGEKELEFIKNKIFLKGLRINTILNDKYRGILWVGTTEGLYILNKKNNKVLKKSGTAFSDLSNEFIYSLFLEDKSNLWIGTFSNGLFKIDLEKNEIEKFVKEENNSGSIKGTRIYKIFQDDSKNIWVCHDKGISKYNKLSNDFENFPKNRKGIKNTLRDAEKYSKDKFIIGTSYGLKFFNTKTGFIEEINSQKKLPNDWIYEIEKDKNGFYWFSTNHGLFSYQPEKDILKSYTKEDGLQSEEFNLSSFNNKKGRFYFGGINGLNYFYPDEIRENKAQVKVAITDLKLFNKSIPINKKVNEEFILEQDLPYLSKIILEHDQNIFTVEYSALSCASSQYEFAYKLDGFENNWNHVGTRDYCTYTNLHPGEYEFNVMAYERNNRENKKIAKLQIIINPPFYQTIPFIILSSLTILILIYILYWYRTRLLRIKAFELEKKVKEKTENLELLNSSLNVEIAERKTIEEELKKSKDQYEFILENINDAIFSLNHEMMFNYISPTIEKILGFYSSDLLYKPVTEIIHPDERDQFMKRFEEENLKNEYKVIDKSGNIKWIRISENPYFEKDEFQYSTGIISDITEQKNLEQKLLQAQKLESIGQLAAGIAHEINTPIQFVGDNLTFLKESYQSYNEMIKCIEEIELSEEVKQRIKELKEEIDFEFLSEEIPNALDQSIEGIARVSEIVKAMKEFSHPRNNEMVESDINHAIHSTVIVSKNVWKYVADLEESYDNSLPPVPCLENQFNQVILNMIVNSAQAIEERVNENIYEKGKILVKTSQNNKYAIITIEDNGGGIPEEIKHKVFDPFFTTKEVGKGTGQGLAIAHDIIVNKHKGEIDFHANDIGGTTFIIKLPKQNN